MIRNIVDNEKYIREEYIDQLNILKEICFAIGKAPHYLKLSQDFGLRSSRWFLQHCKNPKVVDYNSFMEYEVGVLPNYEPSKEYIIDEILTFCKENNKTDIFYKDFENGCFKFSAATITHAFGSLSSLQKELGMRVHNGGWDTKKSLACIKNCLDEFCKYFKTTNLKSPTISMINKFFVENNMKITCQTCQKRLKEEEGSSLREYLFNNNIQMVGCGCGFYHSFGDGEIVYSVYEYDFSLYLRKNGFIFNKDYFRGRKYNSFDSDVSTNINIDYIINKGSQEIFVEIAGFLRDYENHYKKNKIITKNKSKEKYRVKLGFKESILVKNKLNYLILFPNKNKEFYSTIEENCDLIFI